MPVTLLGYSPSTQPSVARAVHADAGDVSFAFAVPQPTIFTAGSHFVDAGDAEYTFAVPQPTVTKTSSPAVDAGDVSWAFAVAEPTATTVHIHTVDAGDVSWAFAVPEPMTSMTRYLPVDAGSARWRFRTLVVVGAFIPLRFGFSGSDGVGFNQAPFASARQARHAVDARPAWWIFRVSEGGFTFIGRRRVRVADAILTVEQRLDLLISQWKGNAQIEALLRGMYEVIDDELVQPLRDLEEMRAWDTARGVWLDYIGRRLGFSRPSIDQTVTRFGFSGSDGVGFNQAPFATATGFIPQVQVGDDVYLLCLRVWAGTILTSGTIPDMNIAVRRAFPAAYYTDGADSTIALVTGATSMRDTTARDILTAADAWPRPAGVGLTVT